MKFRIGISQLIAKILLRQRRLKQIRHCLTEHNKSDTIFLSKHISMTIKKYLNDFQNNNF